MGRGDGGCSKGRPDEDAYGEAGVMVGVAAACGENEFRDMLNVM